MPYVSLANTKTAGNDEVLTTLKFLGCGVEGAGAGYGPSARRIALYLQQNGHYGAHAGGGLTTLTAQVQTVLNNLITLGYVVSTAQSSDHGGTAVPGYNLTRAGVLPSRRARPYGLRV